MRIAGRRLISSTRFGMLNIDMRHPKLVLWEQQLKAIFDKIDDFLEDKYGDLFPLHPSRPARGTTSNKEHDGLFNVGASFSAGFGSEHGPGYVVEITMATLSHVPVEIRRQIERDVVDILDRELETAFPQKILDVTKDGNVFKIHGDLSLGQA
jgi:hypothetical protein